MKKNINIDKIENICLRKDKQMKVKFQFVQSKDFEYTKAGKYKFIINNFKEC